MPYSVRKFLDSDFDDVLALCQNTYKLDSFTKELLREKIYEDPFFDPEIIWIAEEGTAIVGFLMGTCRMDIRGVDYGYVKLMAVEEAHQRKGIARNLYELLEKELRSENIDVVRLGDVPMNYFMPGIDPRYTPALCFAMRLGFNRFMDTANLSVNLSDRKWIDDEENKAFQLDDIEVSRATTEDKDELMNFVADEWKLWQFELAMAYKSDPIAIHIAKLNGKIKAFSAHSANNKGLPWFGPMGTHPDLRGKGIGKALFYHCLEDLKDLGYKTAIIPWVGPIDFYSHHAGALVDRVFWRYEKKIS